MLPQDSTTIPCSPHSTGRLLGGFIYALDLSCPPESEKLQIHITRLTLFRLRSGYLCKVFIHPDLYKNLKFTNLIFIASFTLYTVHHLITQSKNPAIIPVPALLFTAYFKDIPGMYIRCSILLSRHYP